MNDLSDQHRYRKMAINRRYLTVMLYIAMFFIFFQKDGAPISLGSVAASNLFVALFTFIVLVDGAFYNNYPRYFIAPSLLLIAIFGLKLFESGSSNLVFAIQGYLFMLFPYVAVKFGLRRKILIFSFFFVASSQYYLMTLNGGTLPSVDLDGYFVSRRTIHSLAFGFFAILVLPYIKLPSMRVVFFGVVFVTILLAQARGAAILFGTTVLLFESESLPGRTRAIAAVFGIGAVFLSVLLSPELLLHFQVALSLIGGSSTGYRVFLLQILIDEFPRYWAFGMPDQEVQQLLSNRFIGGKDYQTFALDNAFVHFAMKYGALALGLLAIISIKLIATRKPYAVFFVGWLFLDDLMGSGLGWFLLGTTLVLANSAPASSEPRHIID